ncbi:DUF3194 domain-containing protein [Thermococcus waiotapuensis]|uniref:DUF3194 domain-containing protein n=1 Tax=Thermococcus waiotapuensis TaxID=90909 RepID=A0AAE4NW09_9EURY|nr:DUF3194 domain-containing protein [Thermococcus waiotapuensis]MDV3103651.1 DUF3194 domain-containing protein [Thermococcus waiotapuensis]
MNSGERKVIHIGLPELGEEELIEIGELAQKVIIEHIFDVLSRSDVKDIEVTTRINRDETLDLEIEVYLEVPVFVRVDVDSLISEALERAYESVEKKLKALAAKG